MKFLLALSVLVSGCAHVHMGYDFLMQPDGSYVIHTHNASLEELDTLAKDTAARLCPKGYSSKANFSYNDLHSYLVVKCKE